jgi:hypothetical protein
MRKVLALVPSVQSETCHHAAGFAYTGRVPCTGPRVCHMCGSRIEDVCAVCPLALHEHTDPAVGHAFVGGRA